MRNLILILFLSLSLGSYAQNCDYTIDKNGILQTQSAALAFNKDLSGIMSVARREGDVRYLELSIFLPKKFSFKKDNEIQIELKDGRIADGIILDGGTAIYSDAVGYFFIKIRVKFSYDCLNMLAMVPVSKVKMQAKKHSIEMMPVGDSSKFMEIVRCIL
jgi:hypothetical protein